MKRALIASVVVALVMVFWPGLSSGATGPMCFRRHATIVGTNGPDHLKGTAGPDVIVGWGGRDFIQGRGGDDRICGGDGYDRIRGQAGNDRLSGGRAREAFFIYGDILRGGPGNDVLRGGRTSDLLVGNEGNDRLFAGSGPDSTIGGIGNDVLNGGPGTMDDARYGCSATPVQANLSTGRATGQGNDTLTAVEQLVGSRFDDTLIGSPRANIGLIGLGGDDTIRGRGGNDLIGGDDGNDSYHGGSGADLLTFSGGFPGPCGGGPGLKPRPVSVNLLTGTASGRGNDTVASIENVEGSMFSDTLIGNGIRNVLFGDTGHDTISGGGGGDDVDGGEGPDVLDGGPGIDLLDNVFQFRGIKIDMVTGATSDLDHFTGFENVRGTFDADRIKGDAGANVIRGFYGNDLLSGRAGNDTLLGQAGKDGAHGGNGVDVCHAERRTSCERRSAAVLPWVGMPRDLVRDYYWWHRSDTAAPALRRLALTIGSRHI